MVTVEHEYTVYTGDSKLVAIILSNLNRFSIFFHWRFCSKFAVKCLLKIPQRLAYVALWDIKVRKQAINDKLQGIVVTYLRCDRVVTKQIKKGLLLSLLVKFFFGRYFVKLQARKWLSRALSSSFSSVVARRTKCTVNNLLACIFAKYSPNLF